MSETDTFAAFWDDVAARVAAEESQSDRTALVRHQRETPEQTTEEQLPAYSKQDPNASKVSASSQPLINTPETPQFESGRIRYERPVESSELSSRIFGFGPGVSNLEETGRIDNPDIPHTKLLEQPRQRRRRRNRKICCGISLAVIVVLAVAIATPIAIKKSQETRDGSSEDEEKPVKYQLAHQYGGETFFDNFTFFTGTQEELFRNSFVDRSEAMRLNLTSVLADGNVSLGINSESSVRISSNETYSRGLFVFRITDVPMGCDQTPTLRLSTSPNYPAANDITIFQTRGLTGDRYFGARTNGSCTFNTYSKPSAITVDNVCHDKSSNEQCRTDLVSFIRSPAGNPAHTRAVEITSQGVKTWNYLPPSVEAQIDANALNLTAWPDPYMVFPSTCDITRNFQRMHIVADIARCGPYGYYDHARVWRDGDWCERECDQTQDLASNTTNYNSTTWKWSEWKVFLPINETSGDWL